MNKFYALFFVSLLVLSVMPSFVIAHHEGNAKSVVTGNVVATGDAVASNRATIKSKIDARKAEFEDARARFRNSTGKNESERIVHIKEFLIAEIDRVLAHLDLIKERVQMMDVLESDRKGEIIRSIDDDVVLLNSRKADVANADSISDLKIISRSVKKTRRGVKVRARRFKGHILNGRIRAHINNGAKIEARVQEQIDALQAAGKETGEIEILLGEFNSQIAGADADYARAKILLEESRDSNTEGLVIEAQGLIEEARKSLREARKTLEQIIGKIKDLSGIDDDSDSEDDAESNDTDSGNESS